MCEMLGFDDFIPSCNLRPHVGADAPAPRSFLLSRYLGPENLDLTANAAVEDLSSPAVELSASSCLDTMEPSYCCVCRRFPVFS